MHRYRHMHTTNTHTHPTSPFRLQTGDFYYFIITKQKHTSPPYVLRVAYLIAALTVIMMVEQELKSKGNRFSQSVKGCFKELPSGAILYVNFISSLVCQTTVFSLRMPSWNSLEPFIKPASACNAANNLHLLVKQLITRST